jgi:hypothetical protein
MLAIRALLALALGFYSTLGSAAVSCEQLADIALTTEQLRDQGYSLPTVVAEVDKLKTGDKVTTAELARIKEVVEQAFKAVHSPLEILKDCKDRLAR